MKNILVVLGCGKRNGNTDQLADSFIQGAIEVGHNVKKVFLGEKKIEFCRGCNACMIKGQCVIKDDISIIYSDYNKCDMIVLASPLYYWTITGMLKTFIDRLFGSGFDYHMKKDCILLMTARQPAQKSFDQATSYYKFISEYMNWNDKGMVLAGDCGGLLEGRLISKTKYLQEGYELGKSI